MGLTNGAFNCRVTLGASKTGRAAGVLSQLSQRKGMLRMLLSSQEHTAAKEIIGVSLICRSFLPVTGRQAHFSTKSLCCLTVH
jgi:hypothetical protein